MTDKIRVLIADDHWVVRKGIQTLLSTEDDIEIIGEAADGVETVAKARSLKPDVILMDLVMPEMDGIEATRQIAASQTGTRVIVLTSFAADDKVLPAIKAGALGYLLKDSSPEDLIEAIHRVHQGESSLDPSVARKLLAEMVSGPHKPLSDNPLTDRELKVLRLVAQGRNNKEIAEQLVIADITVRRHVSSILSKLHLATRTQAALYALKEGIASLDDISRTDES